MDQPGDHERLMLALEAAGLDLWENDLVEGKVTRKVTKVFEELGYRPGEGVDRVEDIYGIVHPDDVAQLKAAVVAHLAGKTPQYRCEFRLRARSGAWVWYANYGKIMDRDGTRQGRRFVGVTFRIDDRKRKEAELEQANALLLERNRQLAELNQTLQALATTDPLTGLANRRQLFEAGEREVQRAQRMGHALSLLIVDIDDFKLVNDTWGHAAGDQVICAVAATCARSVRGQVDLVGRIGGEEFAVLLPEVGMDDANTLAARLCRSVPASPVPLGSTALLELTVSIGIATLTSEVASVHELLRRADQALYQAKGAGKNCVRPMPRAERAA